MLAIGLLCVYLKYGGVQIYSFLSAQKDVGIADSEKPDIVINNFEEFIQWLDRENPEMAPK